MRSEREQLMLFASQGTRSQATRGADTRLSGRERPICHTSSFCRRFSTPANPIRASEAHAGHCSAQFPIQLQSWQRYAVDNGICCIEWNVIGSPCK